MITVNELASLYYNYKKTSDQDISKLLKTVIVFQNNNGTAKSFSKDFLKKLEQDGPRTKSLTFDADFKDYNTENLWKWKTIPFLVKSSSRFFLKPDIGEIFDAIPYQFKDMIDAIEFHENYQTLEGTEGEHFIMEATLYLDSKKGAHINWLKIHHTPENK